MWQSCPPTCDEMLSSVRTQFGKLSEDYKELQRLNRELEDELLHESKNKEIIKSLKQQRTYLGRFQFFRNCCEKYDERSPYKLDF